MLPLYIIVMQKRDAREYNYDYAEHGIATF